MPTINQLAFFCVLIDVAHCGFKSSLCVCVVMQVIQQAEALYSSRVALVGRLYRQSFLSLTLAGRITKKWLNMNNHMCKPLVECRISRQSLDEVQLRKSANVQIYNRTLLGFLYLYLTFSGSRLFLCFIGGYSSNPRHPYYVFYSCTAHLKSKVEALNTLPHEIICYFVTGRRYESNTRTSEIGASKQMSFH